MDVNVNGVLFTAQAAGRQMARFGNGGSIVLIASMSGSITNKVRLLALVRPSARPLVCLSRFVFWGRAWSSYSGAHDPAARVLVLMLGLASGFI